MNDEAQARAATHRRPLQHFEVAVGIAERSDRAPPDVLIDADRLAGFVIDEMDLRKTKQTGPAVATGGPADGAKLRSRSQGSGGRPSCSGPCTSASSRS